MWHQHMMIPYKVMMTHIILINSFGYTIFSQKYCTIILKSLLKRLKRILRKINHQVMQRRLILSNLKMFLISRRASAWNQLIKFSPMKIQKKATSWNQKIKWQVKTPVMTYKRMLRLIFNRINLTGVRLLRNSYWNWLSCRKAKSKGFRYFKVRNQINLIIPMKLTALMIKSNTNSKLNFRKIVNCKA